MQPPLTYAYKQKKTNSSNSDAEASDKNGVKCTTSSGKWILSSHEHLISNWTEKFSGWNSTHDVIMNDDQRRRVEPLRFGMAGACNDESTQSWWSLRCERVRKSNQQRLRHSPDESAWLTTRRPVNTAVVVDSTSLDANGMRSSVITRRQQSAPPPPPVAPVWVYYSWNPAMWSGAAYVPAPLSPPMLLQPPFPPYRHLVAMH